MPAIKPEAGMRKALTTGGIEALLVEAILLVRSGEWLVREVKVQEQSLPGKATLSIAFERVGDPELEMFG